MIDVDTNKRQSSPENCFYLFILFLIIINIVILHVYNLSLSWFYALIYHGFLENNHELFNFIMTLKSNDMMMYNNFYKNPFMKSISY